MLKPLTIKQMYKMANTIRQDIIKMLVKAGSGHSAGSLGMADVFTALYFSGILKHNPKKPDWPERDRLMAIFVRFYMLPWHELVIFQ